MKDGGLQAMALYMSRCRLVRYERFRVMMLFYMKCAFQAYERATSGVYGDEEAERRDREYERDTRYA